MIHGREVTYNELLIWRSSCQLLLLPVTVITCFIVYIHFLTGMGVRRYFTRLNVREKHVHHMKAIDINNYTACISLY